MRITLNLSRNRGLTLLALILFIAAILIIGATIVYILIRICRRAFPEPPPDHQGQIVQVDDTGRVLPPVAQQGDAVLQPVFVFPAIAAIPTATATDPLGGGWVEIHRTTNCVDWEVILRTNLNYQFSIANVIANDTNEPCPMAFYRMMIHTP